MDGGTTPARVEPDGSVIIQVPNKKVARWVQLGIHVEVEQQRRAARRKAQKLSRKRNRRKH